ncbi:MAG: hypothetical protein P8Y97_06675 [Candidatus Lokiarchaeota archaeon]
MAPISSKYLFIHFKLNLLIDFTIFPPNGAASACISMNDSIATIASSLNLSSILVGLISNPNSRSSLQKGHLTKINYLLILN